MLWDSYSPVSYRELRYGMKSDSFRSYFDLPRRSCIELELAVGSDSAPRDALRQNGWHVRDPLVVARDPWLYQEYLRASLGEFSVAKHGYVVSRSGWFSERSAAYLASGRPVIVEDTGFTDWLGVDRGVLPFRNLDEAVDAIECLAGDYARHQEASNEVVEEYFSSSKVLSSLIERAMSSGCSKVGE